MNYTLLAKSPLFSGFTEDEIAKLFDDHHIDYSVKEYKKNETIYFSGDNVANMGLVLSGSVSIENDDAWGNKSILSKVGIGEIFAEVYALLDKSPILVNVVSLEKSTVLFINCRNLINKNGYLFPETQILIKNLLIISAHKNRNLSRKIFDTSSKSIRGRLISYLSFESTRANSKEFDIKFDRQQLADYLNVDRSALSAELSKMKADGYIDYYKNKFILKEI